MLHLLIIGLLMSLMFVIVPAIILNTMEPLWSWFDSFYYCFISLTTVGLGDFIPGMRMSNNKESLQTASTGDEPEQKGRSVYKTLVTVYLVLGLLAVMTMVHLVTNIPELDITPWFRSQYDTVRCYTETFFINSQHSLSP